MSIKARYKTKYPKIFYCYWGAFDYNNRALGITDEIIENRNKFVEEFEITRRKEISNRLNTFLGDYGLFGTNPRYYYDHVETYYTKTKQHIIIISPYFTSGSEYDEIVKYFEKGGFKLYKPLYSTSASTFIRVVNYDSAKRKYF